VLSPAAARYFIFLPLVVFALCAKTTKEKKELAWVPEMRKAKNQ
jgi:hypothetical protein